jgi:hypothetical protein
VTTHTIKKGEEEEAEEEEKEEQIVLPEKISVGDHAIAFIEKDFKRKEVSWCSCVPGVHSTCCAYALCAVLWLRALTLYNHVAHISQLLCPPVLQLTNIYCQALLPIRNLMVGRLQRLQTVH